MIYFPPPYLEANQFAYSEPVASSLVMELRETLFSEEKTQPDTVLPQPEAVKGDIVALIIAKAEENDIDTDLMLRIAECESGLKSDAIHHNNNRTIDVGIMQLNDIHGLSVEDRLNPEKNIDYAVKLFKRNGTRDWQSSRACWNKYL